MNLNHPAASVQSMQLMMSKPLPNSCSLSLSVNKVLLVSAIRQFPFSLTQAIRRRHRCRV